MDYTFILELSERIVLPLVTLVAGWFAQKYRSKQKKEYDILDNVRQILEMQKKYIEEQASALADAKNVSKRLEAKLDRKAKSIRQANICKHTNEGEGCPVLIMEEKFDVCKADCEKCDLKPLENDKG